MNQAIYLCDLHTHSNRSDGNDSPLELIGCAVASGLRILALTDHDIIAPDFIQIGDTKVNPVMYAKQLNLILLPGIEFSCDTVVDDVHIIALGCNWNHPFFATEHQASIESKIEGYRELCRLLTEDGMIINWKSDILLDGKRDEKAVQRKMIFEVMAQKGYMDNWSTAKLLVKNTARYSVKRKKPDPIDIIEKIHQSGGVAIMAHPYLVSETAQWKGNSISRAGYIEKLIEAGLDGIEAGYPYDKTSYDGALTPEQIEAEVQDAYEHRLPIISGGSDYHNEGRKGAKRPRQLGERGIHMDKFIGNPILRRLAGL